MNILRIYNVSEYIHAGAAPRSNNSFNKNTPFYSGRLSELPDGSWYKQKLPTGGISFILNVLFEKILQRPNSNETLVFCIDDTPRIKRKMYKDLLKFESGYKATRSAKSLDVSIQRESIKDILSLICDNVFFYEDYEADDIIATLVHQYKNQYDTIYIHTLDSDLRCLVDTNVYIDKVGERGKLITKDNFSTILSDKYGNSLPFNSTLLDKLYYGDSSDNIPALPYDLSNKIKNYIKDDMYEYFVNIGLLRRIVSMATDYNELAIGTFDLVSPILIDKEFPIIEEDIDINRLYYLGYLVKNKYCKNYSRTKKYEDIDDVLQYYTNDYYDRGGKF